jgi:hypothetical protein
MKEYNTDSTALGSVTFIIKFRKTGDGGNTDSTALESVTFIIKFRKTGDEGIQH